MVYGNGSGLVIIDILQNVCLLNMGTADLYGSLDPFQRLPKSPKPFGDLASADIVRVDLSNYSQVNETGGNNLPTPQAGGRVKSPDCRRLQKANSSADENSSLSKSRSSSLNSLEGAIGGEGVSAVHLVDSFPTKNDYTLCECLYVGTTLGSLIGIVINLPERGEARLSEPVVVSPSGSLFRLRGAVLTMCFLDSSSSTGAQIRGGDALENVRLPAKHASPSAGASAHGSQDGSPSAHNALTGDQQVIVICTEKMAAVFAIPSQRQMYSQTITESSTVVCAEIINFGGSRYTPCLVAYTAEGFVKAYSLPSLRPMLDVYLVANTPMVKHTMSFSNFGHGLFLCSPTEVQKFSVSTDFMRQFPDMKGTLFQDGLPMPEPPKQSFFKGIFGGGPKPLDREELFGEQAGKPSAATATHVPGANMQAAQSKGIATTNEVAKAKMAFIERGQKLNDLEDRTEAMANEAKQYASNAHAMLQQAKSKKWYQI
jgi:syntaxin-binding protein 5